MKKNIQFLWLIVFILVINGCLIYRGSAVLLANNEINSSVLSVENDNFQQKAGINLTVVKRGLWSMQSTYRNSMIEFYYKSLLDNRLVYLMDDDKKEFAQQRAIIDNTISIIINSQFQLYTEYEKAILLIASTSTLALLNDPNFNRNEVSNMFFKFIGEYDAKEIPGIINAQWFKNRNIVITDIGIIIG
jgi:hypothetical protein